jgi:hypothetical protein
LVRYRAGNPLAGKRKKLHPASSSPLGKIKGFECRPTLVYITTVFPLEVTVTAMLVGQIVSISTAAAIDQIAPGNTPVPIFSL